MPKRTKQTAQNLTRLTDQKARSRQVRARPCVDVVDSCTASALAVFCCAAAQVCNKPQAPSHLLEDENHDGELSTRKRSRPRPLNSSCAGGGKEEEEEAFFNHYKIDLKRRTHTPSGVADAELKLQAGGALRTPTLSRFSPPMMCTIPLPNLDLPHAGRNSSEEEEFFHQAGRLEEEGRKQCSNCWM